MGAAFIGSASADEEFFYDDDADDADEQHGVLNIDNIKDTHGNSWSQYHLAALTNRWNVNAPQFLAVNELGAFTALVTWSGVVINAALSSGDLGYGFDENGIAQVVVTFGHPLDLSKASDGTGGLDTSDDGIVQQSEFAALFNIDSDGTGLNVATPLADVSGNLSISISANGKVVTIDLAEDIDTDADAAIPKTGILAGTTTFGINGAQSALTTATFTGTTTLTVD